MSFFRCMYKRKTKNFMTKMGCFFNFRHWPNITLGLALILFAPRIVALGLGDIHVTSKLGEYFIGRIPIISTSGESIDPSCFKLLSDATSRDETPLMSSARLTVNSGNGAPYLRVSSGKRINDLAVRLLIRAGCESDITREYTILLDVPGNAQTVRSDQTVINAPLSEPALAPPKPVLPASSRELRAGGLEWEVTAGESLTGIAANIYPNNRRMQRRFVRHAIAANSEVLVNKTPDALLPAGTVLHLPGLGELARQPVEKKSDQSSGAESTVQPDTKPDKPSASRRAAKAKKPGTEADVHLKLTTGDLDISASSKVTEGEREILREKQRILMDIDDMAAYNLSLNYRLKQMEEHIQGLQAKLDGLERHRSEIAPGRSAAPALVTEHPIEPAQHWAAYTPFVVFSVGGLGLLMVALWGYLKWKRTRAEADAMMELDIDLDRIVEADPDAKKSGLLVSPSLSDTVSAVRQPERVVPVDGPEIDRQPSSSEAPNGQHGVFDIGLEIALDSIESAIEEADIYLALGEGGRAIDNLKYHIDSQPRATADLWLKLLNIYHDFNMRSEFEISATEFHQYFNIAQPNWEMMVQRAGPSPSIEQFPHLMEKVSTTWGSTACLEYLRHLLLDNRGGHRGGFELGMASDILLLIHILEGLLGKSTNPLADGMPSKEDSALEFTFDPGARVQTEENHLAPLLPELGGFPVEEPVNSLSPTNSPASAQPPKSDSSSEADPRSALERRHNRIAEKLILVWGGVEAPRYLESLVVGDRNDRGGRVGFDEEVVSELMMLFSIATDHEEEVTDIWSLTGDYKMASQNTLKPR